jgi:transposase
MWGLSKQQRYWLWQDSTDMRRSFDGLSGLIRGAMRGHDPLCGDAYIFMNRRRNQLKILVWETGGFLIYHKRLEEGTFEQPAQQSDASLRWDELVLMVEGVVLKGLRRRKRFTLPEPKALKKEG